MKFGVGRYSRLCVTCAILAWLGTLAAGARGAEHAKHIITFDKVVVQGFVGIYDTPEVAHLERPDEEKPSPSAANQGPEATSTREAGKMSPAPGQLEGLASRGDTAKTKAGRQPERGRPVGRASWGSSVAPMTFAPGQGTANPSFIESGFRVEAFWAVKTGTPDGSFKRAHFHPPDLSAGFEALHLGNPNELHGIHIQALDGKVFGLNSLRYRVTHNRQLLWKPFSIEGFSNYNVQVLVARSFNPRWSIQGQFVPFPVGLPVGNDPTLPWWVLRLSGFELVDQVYIASSASVDLDNIVLTRAGGAPPPAPAEAPISGEGGSLRDR